MEVLHDKTTFRYGDIMLTLEHRILNLVECVALLFLIFTDLASRLKTNNIDQRKARKKNGRGSGKIHITRFDCGIIPFSAVKIACHDLARAI